jgi:ribosomal protein L1
MTREEICQRLGWITLPKMIEKIVEAAVLAEREACAKAAEGYADFQLQLGDDLAQWRAIGALAVMAAISERGQE